MEKPLALVGQFRLAVKDVAKRLEMDVQLADVAMVIGTSPLVVRFAPTLERMGFTVGRNDDGSLATRGDIVKVGYMEMSRVEFLKRFGGV